MGHINRFLEICKNEGTVSALKAVTRKVFRAIGLLPPKPSPFNDLIEKAVLRVEEFGTPLQGGNSAEIGKVINFFIPDIGLGSGGHLNIFRFCAELERDGYEINFIIVGGSNISSREEARKIILKCFVEMKTANVYLHYLEAPPCNIAFASSWHSAYYVNMFRGAKHKLYFVQDFEPFFYPAGSHYFLAEQTYRFGFKAVTAGSWLSEKLSREFGCECRSFGFSYEKDLYAVEPKERNGPFRIFYYSRPVTPRRMFKLGVEILKTLKSKHGDGIEIVMAGQPLDPDTLPFEFVNLGLLPLKDLSKLYNSCDIGLVFSGTNVSLLPLELMASGCVVVSNKGPHVEWLLNDHNSVLVGWDFTEIIAKIEELMDNPKLREKIRQQAADFVRSTSWDEEYRKAARYMRELINEPSLSDSR